MMTSSCWKLEKKQIEESPGGSANLRKRFNFGPLKALGVQFEPDKLEYKKRIWISSVHNTETICGLYNDVEIDGQNFNEIYLFYIHNYNKNDIEITIEENLNFT